MYEQHNVNVIRFSEKDQLASVVCWSNQGDIDGPDSVSKPSSDI